MLYIAALAVALAALPDALPDSLPDAQPPAPAGLTLTVPVAAIVAALPEAAEPAPAATRPTTYTVRRGLFGRRVYRYTAAQPSTPRELPSNIITSKGVDTLPAAEQQPRAATPPPNGQPPQSRTKTRGLCPGGTCCPRPLSLFPTIPQPPTR
jgi:hypothetical protein